VRSTRTAFWALTAALVALAWLLPVIPGHDLPQHLAIARILAGRGDPRIAALYHVDTGDAYSTVHRALAWIAARSSIHFASRLTYAAYALLVPVAFASLVRALHGSRGARVTAVLGVALVWNPIACMGFLPFLLALPPFLFGVAALVRFARDGRARDAAVAIALAVFLGAIHVVALAIFVAFAALFALAFLRKGPAALAAALAMLAIVLVARESPSASWHGRLTLAAVAPFWVSPTEKANMALATIFGPFPRRTRLAIEVVALALAALVSLRRSRTCVRPRATKRFAIAAFAFFVLAALAPSSVRRPDDLSYIDFRMLVLAGAVVLAAVPPSWFSRRAPRLALAAAMTMLVACWARELRGASREAEDGVALVSRLVEDDRLLALSFHDRSAYFDESNAMNHYVGVYHTALTGGVTTLFWGKFARHLPIGYRRGEEPPHPYDWHPWEFTPRQVHAATHVLVAWPDANDGWRKREGASRLLATPGLRAVECRGRYCLFEVESSLAQVGLRDGVPE